MYVTSYSNLELKKLVRVMLSGVARLADILFKSHDALSVDSRSSDSHAHGIAGEPGIYTYSLGTC